MQGSIPRHISETLLWRALTARAMFSLLTDLIQNFFVEMDGNKSCHLTKFGSNITFKETTK